VSPADVQLQGLQQTGAAGEGSGRSSSTLLGKVAAALQEPVPAGAYVVRDVKISRLAGELDSLLLG
jgi:hypothetical protein